MSGVQPDFAQLKQAAFASASGWLAFGLGSGLSPVAPGTVGSAAALIVGLPLAALPTVTGLVVVAIAFVVGIFVCERATRALGVHDHGAIVWDEFVGLWLVLVFLPADWRWWLAAFVTFRFFDILKPWPIRRLDLQVGGGFGIMLDDLLAAIYALAVMLTVGLATGWLAFPG
ncbi:MAG: phosphatidylglycerophosphatase A [Wenzhouxiangellaceae bacterium]